MQGPGRSDNDVWCCLHPCRLAGREVELQFNRLSAVLRVCHMGSSLNSGPLLGPQYSTVSLLKGP